MMKVTNETKHVDRLKDDVGELLGYYLELDEVGCERLLNMFHDQLYELASYHESQLTKIKNLQDKLNGHRSVDLDNIRFKDMISFQP